MESKHKYYVIEFKKPPTQDHDKYVCVPNSWTLGQDNADIVFRYPIEKMSVTKKRIIEGEKASEEWPIYLEAAKYKTDNHADANKFRSLMEKSFGKTRRRNSGVNSKSNKPPTPKSKAPNKETQEHRNTDYETDESDEERMEEEINIKTPSHNQYKTPEKNIKCNDRFNRRASVGGSKDKPDIANPISPNNTVDESNALHLIHASLQALVQEVKRQNECIEKLHQDNTVNRNACLTSVDLLKEVAKKLSIDTTRFNGNDTVSENRTPAQVQSGMITKRRRSVRIQEPTRKDDEEAPKRQYIRPFSLPNEYDANDSRWTLRYREAAAGLEELMKGTGVYIDTIRFANCKRLARDEKTLARLLLVEIFTEQALGTCSLTGARAKAFDPDGTNTRPGLDERARNVLLNFVEEYCHEKRWVSSERQSIMNTLRNKMQEIRSRYVK